MGPARMALKIRCPHCLKVLLAEDETAGQPRPCPACGRTFTVPRPLESHSPARAAAQCPRCRAEVAPTAAYCHRCHTDLATGRRLPIGQRLRLFTWRFWAGVAACGIVAVVIAVVGTQVWLSQQQRRTGPAPLPTTRAAPATDRWLDAARRLLAAESLDGRRAALAELAGAERESVDDVTRALSDALEVRSATYEQVLSRIAAIDLLARHPDAPGERAARISVLARAQADPKLRDAALRARGLLGDGAVLDELAAAWLDRLERTLFLSSLVARSPAERIRGAGPITEQAQRDARRLGEALLRLGQDDGLPVYERMAERFWDTWAWLGQRDGDAYAAQLFDLARPAGASMEFRPEDVRRPRDVLRRVSETGAPSARAAAGLILSTLPQYRTLGQRVTQTLGSLLATSDAGDQQRLVYAIGKLSGKTFGTRAIAHPLDVTPEAVDAAQRWIDAGQRPVVHAAYPQPPRLARRVLSSARQEEEVLLAELGGGWERSASAVQRWLGAGLGSTPRIRALLDPSRREPDASVLSSAIVIATASGDRSVRGALDAWRVAPDQAEWLRALAYTALAAFDAREGRWTSGWPSELTLGDTRRLDAGTPGWDYFGRILAAGGPAMLDRLERSRDAGLSREARAKLLAVGRAALEREQPVPRRP